jgi:hypothetical protein
MMARATLAEGRPRQWFDRPSASRVGEAAAAGRISGIALPALARRSCRRIHRRAVRRCRSIRPWLIFLVDPDPCGASLLTLGP